MSKKILVVDDKLELRNLLKSYLTQEGFDVVTANDGQEALYVARHEKPNLIILDLMMPEMGGYEFMHSYNHEADTPVVILTAKIDENDKVLGLELGADDYVTKPFSPRELTARVRAVLRRAEKQASKQRRGFRVMQDKATAPAQAVKPPEPTVVRPAARIQPVVCPRCAGQISWNLDQGLEGFCPYCGLFLRLTPNQEVQQ